MTEKYTIDLQENELAVSFFQLLKDEEWILLTTRNIYFKTNNSINKIVGTNIKCCQMTRRIADVREANYNVKLVENKRQWLSEITIVLLDSAKIDFKFPLSGYAQFFSLMVYKLQFVVNKYVN